MTKSTGKDEVKSLGVTGGRSRRRLVQVLAAAGTVVTAKSIPGKWARPVVESVTLPAHAVTTGVPVELGNSTNLFAITEGERAESLLASGVERLENMLLTHLTETAYAADTNCEFTGCVRVTFNTGESTGTIFFQVFTFEGDSPTAEFSLPFTDGAVRSIGDNTCLGAIPPYTFVVDIVSEVLATLTLLANGGGKGSWTVNLTPTYSCRPTR